VSPRVPKRPAIRAGTTLSLAPNRPLTVDSQESERTVTTSSPRRKPVRMTAARLQAQRANAKRSTGPRTLEGRRRSAFNRMRLPLEYWMRRDLERDGRSLAELRRLWHDLLAIFWFVQPCERYYGIYFAAWCWWDKLDALRRKTSSGILPEAGVLDARIEGWLHQLLSRFAKGELHWQQRVREELGPDALCGTEALRIAVEARLECFVSQSACGALESRKREAPPGGRFFPGHPRRKFAASDSQIKAYVALQNGVSGNGPTTRRTS